ncbi:hypothetical protein HYV44_02665 [Candidatus Microgenomates bacterium]|nr:hypothetical protein [Candidatus Microgenomates bacterium]
MELAFQIIIGVINTIVLIITAVIVWKYTKEAQRSNKIQERPILNLYLRENKKYLAGVQQVVDVEYLLRLRNVGKGPAYNIKFFTITASDCIYYPYINEPNPILENNGDEKTVNLWIQVGTNGTEIFDTGHGFQLFMSRLFPTNADVKDHENLKRTAGIFLITYSGVNDKKYNSIFRIYPRIWSVPKIYDLVVEFISNIEGDCDIADAHRICETIETQKLFK